MTAKAKTPSNTAVQRFVNEGGTTRAGELARKKRPRASNQPGKPVVDMATGKTEDREPTPEEQGKDPAAVLGVTTYGVTKISPTTSRQPP